MGKALNLYRHSIDEKGAKRKLRHEGGMLKVVSNAVTDNCALEQLTLHGLANFLACR